MENNMEDIYKQVKDYLNLHIELYGSKRLLSVELRDDIIVESISSDAEEEISAQQEIAVTTNKLTQFYHEIKGCKSCPLGITRTNFVFGVGNPQAELMCVGEAPGYDEDIQGKPFVGRAGQLLNLMLFSIGMKREDVFIANVLKCRPPNNRDPLPAEVEKCEPYLIKQIEFISPRLIVAMGRFAAASLLRTQTALGRLREEIYSYNNVPLIVTYHPAALLRNPQLKRSAWEDLKKIQEQLKSK
jgi:DNA polymerase